MLLIFPFSLLHNPLLPRPTLFPYTTLFRSTSSNIQNGAGLRRKIENTKAIAVSAFSPPDSRWMERHSRRLPWCFRFSDRKSTRLNSSHVAISYAVFCLKKKKNAYTNYDHYD